jgi:hypothetical protein
MKLMHAFRDCSNVLKHFVAGGSANCFDVERVYPATTCLNKALKSPPLSRSKIVQQTEMKADAHRAMLCIVPVEFFHNCRRVPMSHRSCLTTKKRAVVNKDNSGVMRGWVKVASFSKNTKITFFCIKQSW